ncbi:FxSxx-COOH system tetratricopeptide repeat protein [Plantactinospora sp. GCM10030261]|uniref:FxSxx-COOH system tetratricopeptide repeat protein n=1 Tax=Plantactinospora sp. GCM10030261 TaxID=3273420 RepID=UPI003613DF9F
MSDSPTTPGPAGSSTGQIITFYSYKGGTGRTMAVANVSWILASNGFRVLTLDWDLESPGLHKYFQPFLVDKKLQSSPGVIDLLQSFGAAPLSPGPETGGDTWIREYVQIGDYAASLEWEFPGSGTIDFVPAGRQNSAYSLAVSTFNWDKFYSERRGGTFLTTLRDVMRAEYDYVLVDSRTGLSDAAGVCTVLLPDVVVDCFTMSAQSIDGAVAVAHSIRNKRRDQPIRILPVPMKVEDGEQIKLEAGRDYARAGFDTFLSHLSAGHLNRYWGDVEVPYKSFYAYEEILATFGDRPHQESSLLAAYERLARVLTDGQVSEVGAIDEAERRTWLAEFERPRADPISDVLVSYSAEQRIWAEWITAELTAVGIKATYQNVDAPDSGEVLATLHRALNRTSRVMALLSPSYLASETAAQFWKTVSADDAKKFQRYLIPVRPEPVRVGPPYTDQVPIDLFERSAEQARTALLNGIGRRLVGSGTVGGHGARFPGARPPVSNVPQRNLVFTGRNDLLEHLRDELAGTVTVVMPQALYGLGGVGKTQVALEYANRFAAHYDIVWWISAEQPALVRTALVELGERLRLPAEDNENATAHAVLDHLQRGEPYARWLLIYDNVNEPADVREYIPQGPGDVLLTSRNPAWSSKARPVEVGVFGRLESIALLRKIVPGLSDVDADQVAEKLGDLPLAIEQAGAWLATTAMPVHEYLRELDQLLPQVLAENPPPGYEETAAAIWTLSLDRLRQQRPGAAKLMELCCFFGPEPIPTSLIYSKRCLAVLAQHDPTLRDLEDRMLVAPLVREIHRYALIQFGAGQSTIQVHRLVQAVIQDRLSAEAEENLRHVHDILAEAERKDPDEPGNWITYDGIWPHLVPTKADASIEPPVRQLIIDVVRYLYRRGYYVSCQELAERSLNRWAAAGLSPDDPVTLLLRFHLANALRGQADYAGCFAANEDILERQERTLGSHHPYTLLTARSLGADLRTAGRYAEARALDERTLSRFREVFGDGHRDTLQAANNLGVTLRLVGDFQAAAERDEETLRLGRVAFRDERHPVVLVFAANYGRDLREIGDFDNSHRILEQAFDAHREVLGEDHADTLRTARSLAVTLRKLGELEAARELSRDTLQRHERRHGPEHMDTMACSLNLACDESALGDDRAAQQRAEAVLHRYRRLFGEHHTFTMACANDLSIFVRRLGDHQAARRLSEEVVEVFREVLGDDHPYTLASRANLANDIYSMGDFDQARSLDQEIRDRFERVLGDRHPDTLAVAANLAMSQRGTGDVAAARKSANKVLTRMTEVLGKTHPNVTAAQTGQIRFNCDIEPPPT